MAAVFKHSASKGSARLILLAMADEANDEGLLTAYRRSQSWLAGKANVDSGTARRAIATLVELGEVEVLAVGDGRDSSDYRLILPGLEGQQNEGRQDAPPARASRTPRARDSHPQGARDALPIIPLSPVPPSPPTTPLDGFDSFWQAYPMKAGKGAARKAWPAAVKAAGGVGPILTGALAYAADPNRDPSYTKYPAGWLKDERWNDPPLPPRRDRGTGKANPAKVHVVDDDRSAPGGRLYDF